MSSFLGRAFRAVCFWGGIFCLIFALIPYLMYGIFNEGVLALFLLAGGSFLCWSLITFLKSKRSNFFIKFLSLVKNLLCICLTIFIILEIIVSIPMIWAASYNPPSYSIPQTVVVLGCLTKNGEPSLMLSRRIEAAFDVLEKDQQAVVIVTGGYSPNETLTQAEISKNVLVSKGIAPERIYIEKNSEDTDENLKFSARIIRENNLPTDIIIATDGFHQLRGSIYAGIYGLSPTSVSSHTPWGLLPSYWIREQGGLVEILLKEKSDTSQIARMALQILTSI